MKKVGAALLIGAMLGLAAPAMADQIQVGFSGTTPLATYQGFGPYQTGIGGEFTLNDYSPDWLSLSGYVDGTTKNLGPSGITSFQTFCIEGTETISGYPTVYNAQLSTYAMFGSQLAPGDRVSKGTGWLYSQFATTHWLGTLSYDYTATSGRNVSADLLQKAIWWLEGEENIGYDSSNMYMAAVVSNTIGFGSEADAKADGAELYGVSAVNLWHGSNPALDRAQDQLYYKPGATINAVPDGGWTLALLGMAMCGMAIVSRRFRRI